MLLLELLQLTQYYYSSNDKKIWECR